MHYNFSFNTEYNQFYISDKASPGNTSSPDFCTTDSYRDRLAIERGILGIGTECYGPVKGELNILTSENIDFDSTKYDHIVEGGLEIISNLLIFDCPNSHIEVQAKIKPGKYRVRVYSSNLISVVDDEEADDYYKIEIGPGDDRERKVLKRYIPQ